MSESGTSQAISSTERPTQEQQESASPADESLIDVDIDVEVDLRKALFGGVLAALVALAGSFAVGRLSGAEGLVLLEAMLPTTRFLCSAMMTASGTILALMLTLLGMSHQASPEIRPGHYKRIKQIALIDAIAFVAATLLLLLINVPLEETKEIPAAWFNTLYYFILVMSSMLGGLLITVVLMLYSAVRDMIHVVGLGTQDHPIVSQEQESESTS